MSKISKERLPSQRGAAGHAGRRNPYCRHLACEPLEDRRLLSVGVAGRNLAALGGDPALAAILFSAQTADTAAKPLAVAGATTAGGATTPAVGALASPAVTGPVISKIVVVPQEGLISWNVQAQNGVASTSLVIDGTIRATLFGPVTDPSGGVDFSGTFGTLSAGPHTYVITVFDKAGAAAQSTAVFQAPAVGPTISNVVVVTAQGLMSWNVQASAGVAVSTLSVDGSQVTKIFGPVADPSGGVNFSGTFGALSAGTHDYLITAADNLGTVATLSGSFVVSSAGPTISKVVVLSGQGLMSWNVQAAAGVASSSLMVDGSPVTKVSGPFTDPSGGVNFSGTFGTVAAGTHSFTITATDKLGVSSQLTGSFNVTAVGPTISNIEIVTAKGFMTWNVQASAGVASSTLSVDNQLVSNVSGPFAAPSGGVNFSGTFGTLSSGTHVFLITATDNLGTVATSSGSFVVSSAGPTISKVVVLSGQGLMSWNVQAAAGVASSSLTVDGSPVINIFGPVADASGGVDFSGTFGAVAAGTHSFTITATDNLGVSSQFTGSFNVTTVGPTISKIVIVAAKGFMTWNVQSPNGVASSLLTVDGILATTTGPFTDPSGGVNFSGSFGTLRRGTHTYLISATDNFRIIGTSSGTFTV